MSSSRVIFNDTKYADDTEKVQALGDGKRMPKIGFGVYQIANDALENVIPIAVAAGYRHFDTAFVYQNEDGVGKALSKSGLKREDYFVTTKIFPTNMKDQSPLDYDATIKAGNRCLTALNMDYVDLLLIHAPFGGKERIAQYKALLALQAEGKVISVGVSNYNEAHLNEIREAGLPMPAANQLELHPQCIKTDLLAYMKANNIAPIAYSSLVPLSNWRKQNEDVKSTETSPVEKKLVALGEKYSVSQAQILLRYGLDKGWFILPKSTTQSRIEANIDLYKFKLTDGEVMELDGFDEDLAKAWADYGGDPTKKA